MWAEGSLAKEGLLEVRHRSDLVEQFRNNCHSPEIRAKIAAKQIKNHGRVISPTGEIFEVIGLKAFCLEHDIPLSSIANISKLLKGKVKSVCGWKKV
jgi:hypothetical protein